MCVVDGQTELALELAFLLLDLPFAFHLLVAGDGTEGLLRTAEYRVVFALMIRPPWSSSPYDPNPKGGAIIRSAH